MTPRWTPDADGLMERFAQFTEVRTGFRFLSNRGYEQVVVLRCARSFNALDGRTCNAVRMSIGNDENLPILDWSGYDNPVEPIAQVAETLGVLENLYDMQKGGFNLLYMQVEEFFSASVRVLN